ncbi:hypothetical protein GOD36_25830 [Sinorhizobium medicae]|nr:hypothetical protein [Sinorhizobium medicae]MDX0827095.1 hypothetical protein [Sinorhizobium medicae]
MANLSMAFSVAFRSTVCSHSRSWATRCLMLSFCCKREAFPRSGLKPASAYASSAVLPLASACANFSCRAFFSTGIVQPWGN